MVWPLSNAQLNGFTLTFAGLQPKLDIEGGLDLVSGIVKSGVEEYLRNLLIGTRFAQPGYDPTRDPHLVGELFDPDVLGDLNRVRYNFEKNQEPEKNGGGKDRPELPQVISDASIYLNAVHQKGIPPPADGWGVVIEPGTPFQLAIHIQGRGDELMQKQARLQKLRITSSGIFVYKGKEKIVMLTGVEMDPGLNFKLDGVKAFVDLKELLKREYPGKFADAAASALQSADDIVDTLDAIATFGGLLAPRQKSDVTLTLTTKLSEWLLGGLVRSMLSQSWNRIKGALDLTDKQLTDFFGLNVDPDK